MEIEGLLYDLQDDDRLALPLFCKTQELPDRIPVFPEAQRARDTTRFRPQARPQRVQVVAEVATKRTHWWPYIAGLPQWTIGWQLGLESCAHELSRKRALHSLASPLRLEIVRPSKRTRKLDWILSLKHMHTPTSKPDLTFGINARREVQCSL